MTQAVAVRRDGDAFQARIFWRKAACLLDPRSNVHRVGFESGPRGFDDVWVSYMPGRTPNDLDGNPILREHIQCKYHVSVNDFGHADLINPEWINANKVSLLQRARAAQVMHAPGGSGARFKLVTNWRVGQTDSLRRYIGQKSKTLRLKDLFNGKGDTSDAGKVRKLWREHLEIDDVELLLLARTLAFDTDMTSLDDHRDNLDLLFENVGLVRVAPSESSFIYDDIAYQWLAQGRLEFDRETFRAACKKEDLLASDGRARSVWGVKSFEHPFDRLEERCTDVLDLVPQFDERSLRSPTDWAADLYPKLKAFLHAAAKDHQHLRLILDTHITLAYAAGSVLNIKAGRNVELEQRTLHRSVWRSNDIPSDPSWSKWEFSVEDLGNEGGEIAVAVSLTHDVGSAVKAYIAKEIGGVGKLMVARPTAGPGAKSVECGQHAFELAEGLALKINTTRTSASPPLHLFIAAPNAFTFFLGQRQQGLGRTILYEFDFEGEHGGSYKPSLSLPL